jgi:hypothetical protein
MALLWLFLLAPLFAARTALNSSRCLTSFQFTRLLRKIQPKSIAVIWLCKSDLSWLLVYQAFQQIALSIIRAFDHREPGGADNTEVNCVISRRR